MRQSDAFSLLALGQHVSHRVTKTHTPLQCPVIMSACTQTCTHSPLKERGQSHDKGLTVWFVQHHALSYIGWACTVDWAHKWTLWAHIMNKTVNPYIVYFSGGTAKFKL